MQHLQQHVVGYVLLGTGFVLTCLLLFFVWWAVANRPTKEEKRRERELALEEKHREQYLAHIVAPGRHRPLDPEATALMAAWHEDVTATRTGEIPMVIIRPHRVKRRVVHKDPFARKKAHRERELQREAAELAWALDPLAARPLTLDKDIPLSVRPIQRVSLPFPDLPAEPEPWHLESFTQGWTRGQIKELIAAGPPK